MRIGIIGCGAVARYCHVPALERMKGITIVAAADPDESSSSQVARATGAAVHESAESLLARDDIHAVVISVPSHLHAAVAIAAANAGKAFYLEKPIATTMQDARDVCRAATDAGVAAAVGFNRRAHPLHVRARNLIAGGALGEVHSVHSVFSEPSPRDGMPGWKRARATGGGALLDLASHHVDLVRWLLGTEVCSVSATMKSAVTEDDSAAVSMTLAGGAQAQCFFSLRSAYADHVEIIGERATLRIDRHLATLSMMMAKRLGYGARKHSVGGGLADIGWRVRRVAHPAEDPSYFLALEAFASQVRGERGALASLEDGERSLAVVLAAEESARSGAPVRVEQ